MPGEQQVKVTNTFKKARSSHFYVCAQTYIYNCTHMQNRINTLGAGWYPPAEYCHHRNHPEKHRVPATATPR